MKVQSRRCQQVLSSDQEYTQREPRLNSRLCPTILMESTNDQEEGSQGEKQWPSSSQK